MMAQPVIHCTAKLGKLLAVKGCDLPERTDAWNAHLFPYSGRKCIVFVHAPTGYCLLVLDVVKAELVDLPTRFSDLLREQLLGEWPMHGERINAWLKEQAPAIIAPTNGDKRTLGVINRYIFEVTYVLDRHHPPLSRRAAFLEAWNKNDGLVGARTEPNGIPGQAKYFTPAERMAAHIGIPYDRQDYSARQSKALFPNEGPWRPMRVV